MTHKTHTGHTRIATISSSVHARVWLMVAVISAFSCHVASGAPSKPEPRDTLPLPSVGDCRTVRDGDVIQVPSRWNGRREYDNDEDRCWLARAPEADMRVVVTFEEFAVEDHALCGYDQVSVYDGRRPSTDMLLARECGRSVPSPITSTQSSALIHFTSDYIVTKTGFVARVTFVGSDAGCTRLSGSGRLEYPDPWSSNRKYGNFQDECWVIEAQQGTVDLRFEEFNIESHRACSWDSLSVYDGSMAPGNLLDKLCGQALPAMIRSTSSLITLHFMSDGIVGRSGFIVDYDDGGSDGGNSDGEESEDESDGGNSIGVDECIEVSGSGSIQVPDPYGSGNYDNNQDICYWIRAGSSEEVSLVFKEFSVEGHSTCGYDVVKLYDGDEKRDSRLLDTLCGSSAPSEAIVSTRSSMILHFTSDYQSTRSGFVATYRTNTQVSTSSCEILTSSSGLISVPEDRQGDDSAEYEDNEQRCFIIRARSDEMISISFLDIDIEDDNNCLFDSLSVYEGEEADEDQLLRRVCGTEDQSTVTTDESSVLLYFSTDATITRTGFTVSFAAYDPSLPGTESCGEPAISPMTNRNRLTAGTPKIIGGEEAVPHSWPWMVRYHGVGSCGGSIISPNYVLTAAHCVSPLNSNTFPETVRVGDHNRDVTDILERSYDVTDVYIHEHYGEETSFDNDVALLKLAEPIQFNDHVGAVCLPDVGELPPEGDCVTIGWGDAGLHESLWLPDLQQLELPIMSHSTCTSYYGSSSITDTMICAGFEEGGRDSCYGDSGGPLMCYKDGVYKQFGITSWGVGCAEARRPGVYAKVAQLRQWIYDNTNGDV